MTSVGAYLGGAYINDISLFGQNYRVMLQADGAFRASADDLKNLYVRSNSGDMVAVGSLISIEEVVGPESIKRYNMSRSANITVQPKPEIANSEIMAKIEEAARTTLPTGYNFSWTGTVVQQQQASSYILIILALAVGFSYLFLVGQYESWSVPFSVMLTVFTAMAGGLVAIFIAGSDINLYSQLALIILIGMSAKNAILIVEFASKSREEGHEIIEAAQQGASVRFRAVMMTGFAFLMGVVPLMTAQGAGAAGQQALGLSVFGGMLASVTIGFILAPLLFIIIQRLREFVKG